MTVPGCSGLDIKCICNNKSYLEGQSCCLFKACPEADQQRAISFAVQLCKTAGVDVPQEIGCADGSGSSSSSVTAGASASSAASSAVSSATNLASSLRSAASSVISSATSAAAAAATGGANPVVQNGMGLAGAMAVAAVLL